MIYKIKSFANMVDNQNVSAEVIERQRRVTVLLVVTVVTFVLLTIPLHVSLSISAAQNSVQPDAIVSSPYYILSIVNYACNFPLYCLSTKTFRQHFLRMFGVKPNTVAPINREVRQHHVPAKAQQHDKRNVTS